MKPNRQNPTARSGAVDIDPFDPTRLISLIQAILLGVILLVLVTGLVAPGAEYSRQETAGRSAWLNVEALLAAAAVILLGSVWLNRKGHTRLATLVLLATMLGLVTALLLRGQGIHDIAMLAYPAVLLVATLLLSRRWYLLVSLLVIASANLVITVELLGLLDAQVVEWATDPGDLVEVSVLLGGLALVVWLLMDRMLRSLERARLVLADRDALLTETRLQAERLATLNQVSQATLRLRQPEPGASQAAGAADLAGSGPDLARTLEALYQQMRRVTVAESFYVALYDAQTQILRFPLFISRGEPFEVAPQQLRDKGGLAAEVINTRQTLHLTDVARPEVAAAHEIVWVGPLDTRSYLGIPLILHDQVIGVLSVQSADPDVYSPEDVRLLETIAAQVAITIENARLFDDARDALRREQQLNNLARALTSTLDVHQVLVKVVELSVNLLDADSGSLSLLSDDGQQVDEVYDYNLPGAVAGVKLPRGQGLIWQTIETRQPLCVDQYSSHPRALPELAEQGAQAFLCVPLLARAGLPDDRRAAGAASARQAAPVGQAAPGTEGLDEECLGVLAMLSLRPARRFGQRDVDLLASVGRQAGVAIQNARLFAALRQELGVRQRAEDALHHHGALLEAVVYAAELFLRPELAQRPGLAQRARGMAGLPTPRPPFLKEGGSRSRPTLRLRATRRPRRRRSRRGRRALRMMNMLLVGPSR